MKATRLSDRHRWRQMKGHGSKFGRKKEAAIAALLTQRNIEDAARSVDIAVSTLLRWKKEPEFDAAFRAARRAAYGQTMARLQQGSTAAATILMKVMWIRTLRPPLASEPPRSSSITPRRRLRSRTSRREFQSWNVRQESLTSEIAII